MTDQPQDYAKWCQENLPDGYTVQNSTTGYGCSAYPPNNGIMDYFTHAALAEIARLRAELERRDWVVEAQRSTLLELRIRLYASGRRPEECYEMSIIDAALAARAGGEK